MESKVWNLCPHSHCKLYLTALYDLSKLWKRQRKVNTLLQMRCGIPPRFWRNAQIEMKEIRTPIFVSATLRRMFATLEGML